MKVNHTTSAVSISGAVGRPSSFNITASREAFRILSSGLYNNKILAIVRELSCNALDAHIAAGCSEKPFELHLPTTFEPHFIIKDEGIGLAYCPQGCAKCRATGRVENEECSVCRGTGDYDAVLDLYCNYFATSKSNSNDFVGALGLGSKSPFCYTEGFAVVNHFDGVRRVYSCFINEQGVPDVLLQEVEETPDVHNGVEVSFAVKQKDVWEFENQASSALEFFEPRPNINIDLTIKKQDYTIKTPRWALRKNDKLGGKVRAIQGVVSYDIGVIDSSKLSTEQRELLKLPLDLFFPIGELEVTASRESLSNNPETIDNILKALAGIKEKLIEDVKEKIKSAKSYWEARILLFSFSNMDAIGPFVTRALANGEFNGVYKGLAMGQEDPSISQLDYPEIELVEFSKSWRYGEKSQAKKEKLTSELLLPGSQFAQRKYKIDFRLKDKSMVFVINDLGFGAEKYIHRLIQHDNSFETVYFVTRRDKDTSLTTVIEGGFKIVEQLGQPPLLMLSQLKERYKASMPKTESVTRDLLYYDVTVDVEPLREGYQKAGWRDGWQNGKNCVVDPEKVKYYVSVKNLKPLKGQFDNAQHFKTFLNAIRSIEHFGLKGETIFGVPVQFENKLDDSWEDLIPYVLSKLNQLMTPEKELHLSLHLKPFKTSKKPMLLTIGKENKLDLSSPLKQFCNELVKATEFDESEMKLLSRVVSMAEREEAYNLIFALDFNQKWEELEKIYPLLPYVDENHFRKSEEVAEATYEYIRLLDQKNQAQSVSAVAPDQSVEATAFINPQTIPEEITDYEQTSDTIN